jgi:GalNAc-alpha-(1->4)-GalNAc-alpha-(1->3)-diNAcBac-PP-undecaprenol alpha-1,4-N-acetyl-D-galactosaminyltransferase
MGGAERVVSSLANELSNTYEIIIVTLSGSDSHYHLHPDIKHIKCSTKSTTSGTIFKALSNNYMLTKKLISILKNYNSDLVIGFTTTANILALIASQRLHIPCIISERSNPYIYVPNKFWTFLRKLTYKKANYIIVQTKLVQSFFNQFTNQKKVIILPNPLAVDLTTNKQNNVPKENVVLSVGRLDKNKAQDLLIRAFSNIDNTNWTLVFVGDGIEKQNYINLTKELNIESKVTFVGNSSKIYDYYNSSKIFAFTSKSEGFPNALIEAMYFELPCISTNCPTGPSEIIIDGINGFLIPVNDQSALEHNLEQLISSEELQKELGKNAYHTVKKFESEHVVSKWEKIIQKII